MAKLSMPLLLPASRAAAAACRRSPCSHVAMALVMVHAAVHCSLALPPRLVKKGEVLQYTGNLRGNMALQLACSSTRAVLLAARGVHACARLQRGSRARCLISHTYTAPSSDHACATKECAESAHLLAGCCCRCVTGGRRLL